MFNPIFACQQPPIVPPKTTTPVHAPLRHSERSEESVKTGHCEGAEGDCGNLNTFPFCPCPREPAILATQQGIQFFLLYLSPVPYFSLVTRPILLYNTQAFSNQ